MVAPEMLKSAVAALDSGDRLTARKLLARLLQEEPNNDQAWVLLAEAVEDPQRQRDCLERALKLNPANEVARLMLAPAPTDAEAVWHHGEPARIDSETEHGEWSGWDETGKPADAPAPQPPDPEDLRARIERARHAPATLDNALELADLGQPSAARHKLRQVLKRDPHDEVAWVALVSLIDDDDDRAQVAKDAMRYFPESARLAAALGTPDVAPVSTIPIHTKTPLEMIQERAAAEGEPVGPIRARREAGGNNRQGFFEIWTSALLGPTKSNYQEILDNNPPSLLQAMTWVGLCGGVSTLFQIAILFGTETRARTLLAQLDQTTLLVMSIVAIIVIWITPGLGLLINALAVSVASVVVGGNIDVRAQAFLTAAWQAPLTLLTSLLIFVPYANVVGGVAIVLYQIVLGITTTQAAQDVDGFQAVVSLILSAVVMALPFCLFSLFAPALGQAGAQLLQTIRP